MTRRVDCGRGLIAWPAAEIRQSMVAWVSGVRPVCDALAGRSAPPGPMQTLKTFRELNAGASRRTVTCRASVAGFPFARGTLRGLPRSRATSRCSCAPCPRPSIIGTKSPHRERERHPSGIRRGYTVVRGHGPRLRGGHRREVASRALGLSVHRPVRSARRLAVLQTMRDVGILCTFILGQPLVPDGRSWRVRCSGHNIERRQIPDCRSFCPEYCVIFTGRSRVFVEHELYKTTYQRLAACRECRTSFAHLADMKQEDLPYLHRKVSES